MNFDLSEEQYALLAGALRYHGDAYPLERLRAVILDGAAGFERDVWRGLADLGYAGLGIPEPNGGMGLGLLDCALVAEAIGYCGAPSHFAAHVMGTQALVRGGSPEQQAAYLPALAAGEKVVSVALAETNDRWQPEQWQMQPVDGRLAGSKRNVLFAADVDVFVVGLAGGTLGLVEKDAPGLSVEAVEGIDRTRPVSWLHFDATPVEVLSGGVAVADRMMDAGLVVLAADAFGGASRAVELTIDYVRTRIQFGKPIGSFQGVKHRIADVATLVEASRGLYWYAAHAFDERPDEASRTAALAKALLADRYEAASRAMIELHGGIGFTWEHHAQVWYKRAIFDRYYLGQPAVHRERAANMAGW
jgi:alkylation response protein AidB-like acyl-CoA dehydrogenase